MVSVDHHTPEELRRMHQHDCCVGVVCQPRNVGTVTLNSVRESVCRCGSHLIVEMGERRTVAHRMFPHTVEWWGWTR